jgi:hypothetical protein
MIPFVLASLVLAPPPPDPLVGKWRYVAWNEAGKVIYQGTMQFRKAEKAKWPGNLRLQFSYVGTRRVRGVHPELYGPHDEWEHSRRETGKARQPDLAGATLEGRRFRADLNAGYADTNIILNGTLHSGRIDGKWGWSTFRGYAAQGKFALIRS